jgi:aminoglycoside 3-N-acetyltransferase
MISPRIEVKMRQLYWHNVKYFSKFNPFKHIDKVSKDAIHVDFDEIIDFLKCNGIKKGSLIIVHSSYDMLKCTGLSPKEIIDKLLDIIGDTGTLAMPAIRSYKEIKNGKDRIGQDVNDIVCRYDKKRTPINTGILSFTLVRYRNSIVSPHPINTMVAIGPLAKAMMEHNIDGETPSPSGPNSSWKFCYDNKAKVIGLGVDLEHYNSMLHVAEEAFGDWHWPDYEWFRLRKFDLVNDDGSIHRIVVKERKPEWGMLYLAEKHMNYDLTKAGIYKRTMIKGAIPLCIDDAQEYVSFFRKRNKNGYPYFK